MDIFVVCKYFVGFFLAVCFEIRWKQLVLSTIYVSIFPVTFNYFCWSISNILSIHLLQHVQEISWLSKWYKPIPPGLASPSISDYSSHIKRGISCPKYIWKNLISCLITQVSHKNPIVVFGPLFHCFVLPDYASNLS